MDIVEKLKAVARAEPFDGLDNAWRWSLGRFHFGAALTDDRRHLLQTSCRDFLDEEVLRQALAFARGHAHEVLAAAPLALVEGFAVPGYRFDILVGAMPAAHRVHRVDDPELHAATYAVYPAYRCEFSGLETEDEARFRFQKDVGLGDYRRRPQAVVRMRYENTKNRSGSVGDERGFSSLDYLLRQLEFLADSAEGSFVEFENFRGEVRRVDWRDGSLTLSGAGDERSIPRAELVEWVREFVCPGMDC